MSKILQLDPSDKSWGAFVDSIPQANIFHHPAWANVLTECYGYQLFRSGLPDGGGNWFVQASP